MFVDFVVVAFLLSAHFQQVQCPDLALHQRIDPGYCALLQCRGRSRLKRMHCIFSCRVREAILGKKKPKWGHLTLISAGNSPAVLKTFCPLPLWKNGATASHLLWFVCGCPHHEKRGQQKHQFKACIAEYFSTK